MTRVLASAIVDPSPVGALHPWRVTVNGVAPFDQCRIYHLGGKDDNEAAQEGIRLFVAEMEALGL